MEVYKKKLGQENSQDDESFIPDQESKFELDKVNQHWCMKNIKRSIEKMIQLFGN
jgi:hypothetical protein